MEDRQSRRRDRGGDLGIIRVAYLFNHSFFLGGGEISFLALIRSVDRSQVEPVALVPEEGEIAAQLRSLGMNVRACRLPPLRSMDKGAPFASLFRLAGALRRSGAHILHTNGSRACLYGGLAGRMLGIPVIWHVRETIRDMFFYDGFLALLAGKVVCVSGSVRDKRFQRFPALIRDRTHVVYNGVDTLRFKRDDAARERFRKDLNMGDGILFGMVGSILPLKGQAFFLKGLARAKDKTPGLPAKAVIIGRPLDAAYYEMVRRLVSETGLGRDVRFLEYSDRMTEVFSGLDVFVLPSMREGFSRSLLEAMSAGLPVVATRIKEIQEAVVEGENAILVDFNDVEEMASAITEMCGDRSLRDSMGEKNSIRVKERFDLRSHAMSMETIYRRLLQKSR